MQLSADWSFKRSCRLFYYVTEIGSVVSGRRPKSSPLLLTWQQHFLGPHGTMRTSLTSTHDYLPHS